MEATNQLLPKKMKQSAAKKHFGVSGYFLRKAIHNGMLSYTKIGNCYMIDTDELQKFIELNTHRM